MKNPKYSDDFHEEEERWSVRKGISNGYGCEQSEIRDDEPPGNTYVF